ncbi:MAG: site-specific DNA-methyltransferase [Prolixibacteraceae bacterium]|nr:site-specific DNA-methyltransferase [Prolixibacteraceae bacterium]
MERLDENFGKSEDMIASNIEQLKQLFPEAFTEGKIDFEVLKQLLGEYIETNDEKYGLNWFGKKKARQFTLTPSLGTLRPCPEESVDWDTTKNIMIEGDNLEVLKLLQKSYVGRVKLIYIDPPYNTGKDFVYPDNFQDSIKNYMELTGQIEGGAKISSNTEAGGRYHTDWLNMMYPRISLARNLMSNDGVVFISIDDSEQASLKLVCDEIFGSENFVAQVVWERAYAPVSLKRHFSESHDYIICYAKNIEILVCNGLNRSEEADGRYKNPDNDPRGVWQSDNLSVGPAVQSNIFEIVTPSGRKVMPPSGYSWRLNKDRFNEYVRDNRIWFGEDGENVPRIKRFLSEVKQGITPMTIWNYKHVGHSQKASQDLKKLFDDKAIFTYPKPVELIGRMLELYTQTDSIIMDFFSGSGTTGHAVMKQNTIDGGNRRFILVQLPEVFDPQNNEQANAVEFCDKNGRPRHLTEITKERLRRAGKKVIEDSPGYDGDLGFRVFKLDSSCIKAWDPSTPDIEGSIEKYTEYIKPDRSAQDILFELLIKLGIDLSVQIESREISQNTVYNIGYGVLLVCLSTHISGDQIEPLAMGMIEWIQAYKPETESMIVFRDSAFENDVAKTNMTAIFNQHGFKNIRSL